MGACPEDRAPGTVVGTMQGGSVIRRAARRVGGHHRTATAVVGMGLVLVMSGCGAAGAPLKSGTGSPSAPAGTSAHPSGAASATPAAPTPTPPATDLMAYAATMDGNVVPVDVTAGRAEAPIPADLRPEAIAITPDGRTAYVADAFAATVTPIDLTTGVAGAAIPIAKDGGISSIAISPSGAIAYVAVVPTAQAYGVVVPIDLATRTLEPGIVVGAVPVAIGITPTAPPPMWWTAATARSRRSRSRPAPSIRSSLSVATPSTWRSPRTGTPPT